MASSVALVFSKIVDPKNPLYLDEDSKGEIIDWEFGVSSLQKKVQADSHSLEITEDESRASKIMLEGSNGAAAHRRRKDEKSKTSNADGELPGFKLVDPDEIIDPATLNNENSIDEEDDDDESSSVSSDSSLQPYNLSDDDADLEKKFSQLGDVIVALRKSDDPDGVSCSYQPFYIYSIRMLRYQNIIYFFG